MEVETTTPSGQPIVDRSKVGYISLRVFHSDTPLVLQTTLFLIRTFVKIGGFHRLTLFEDGTLPTTDEHQIFTWYDYLTFCFVVDLIGDIGLIGKTPRCAKL